MMYHDLFVILNFALLAEDPKKIVLHHGYLDIIRILIFLFDYNRFIIQSCTVESLITSQQLTKMFILLRSVNDYSEVTLRAHAVMSQAHISCIAALYQSQRYYECKTD